MQTHASLYINAQTSFFHDQNFFAKSADGEDFSYGCLMAPCCDLEQNNNTRRVPKQSWKYRLCRPFSLEIELCSFTNTTSHTNWFEKLKSILLLSCSGRFLWVYNWNLRFHPPLLTTRNVLKPWITTQLCTSAEEGYYKGGSENGQQEIIFSQEQRTINKKSQDRRRWEKKTALTHALYWHSIMGLHEKFEVSHTISYQKKSFETCYNFHHWPIQTFYFGLSR